MKIGLSSPLVHRSIHLSVYLFRSLYVLYVHLNMHRLNHMCMYQYIYIYIEICTSIYVRTHVHVCMQKKIIYVAYNVPKTRMTAYLAQERCVCETAEAQLFACSGGAGSDLSLRKFLVNQTNMDSESGLCSPCIRVASHVHRSYGPTLRNLECSSQRLDA